MKVNNITKQTIRLLQVTRITLFALALLISVAGSAVHAQKIVDQILVTVNSAIITRIDLLWSIALDPEAPSPEGPINADLLRLKLDVMIDLRLIEQEASKIPSADIKQDEIDKRRTELIASFPSEAEFRRRVESVGLTPTKIDELIRNRILVERFLDFRFRSFVFVSENEIKQYYDEQLAPKVREQGAVPPPIEQVREKIIEQLRGEKVNQELDRWIAEARQRSDIVQLAEP